MKGSIKICGVRVDMVQIPDVIKIMEGWIEKKEYGNYVAVANANDVVIGKKMPQVRVAMNGSSLTVPDGISIVLASRFYGFKLKRRVYGAELMLEFLRRAQAEGYTNFFYGSTTETLNRLREKLISNFPRLNIKGVYSPPFRELSEDEDRVIIEMINELSPDIVWVGLGCPKQQLWMYENKDKLKVPVMVGVGAAFDFLAGTKPQAPRWIRDNGFEWLFRLLTEPKRLWKRYLINGSLFVFCAVKELIANYFKNRQV